MKSAIETKVTAATIGSLLAAIGVELLNAFLANHQLFGNMHPILQGILIVVAVPVITFLVGFQKSSSTSVVSDGYNDKHSTNG